jgi:hypothetical protein
LPRRLSDLGIKILRLDRGRGGINLVDRADARRVLGLLSDPDAAPIGSQGVFTAELVEHVRRTTTFRLLSQIDGLTFRTGKGTFRLFMTIDWERGTLQIGPKYNSRKSPRVSDLLQRKSEIGAAFGRDLTWIRDNEWLRVYTSVANLNFDKPARWRTPTRRSLKYLQSSRSTLSRRNGDIDSYPYSSRIEVRPDIQPTETVIWNLERKFVTLYDSSTLLYWSALVATIRRALKAASELDLDVKIVSYSRINEGTSAFVAEFR